MFFWGSRRASPDKDKPLEMLPDVAPYIEPRPGDRNLLKFKLHRGIKVPIVPVPKLPQSVESVALPRSVLNVLKGKGYHGHLSPQTREKGNGQTLR